MLPAIDLEAYFPYRSVKDNKELSDEERHFQLLQLDEHTTKIKRTFAGVVFSLQKNIEETSKLDDLINVLKNFDCKKFDKLLADCSSIAQVFGKLHPYFSFFDFELIKLMTSNLGSRSNKEKLKKYKKMFKDFSKQRVCECPSDAFGYVDKSEKVFVMKMDKHIQSLTLGELEMLKYEISKVLKYKLRLLSVEEGCVRLVCRILQFDDLVVTEDQQQALKKINILSIHYGDLVSVFSDEKSLGKTEEWE